MKRSWLPLISVLVLGALAGVAIAGRPSSVDTMVITPVPATVVAATTEATATAATTTVASPTSTSTSVKAAPSTSAAISVDRSSFRVVAANATSTIGLAGRTAVRLTVLGYTRVTPTDALNPAITSTIFYRIGFAAAASQLAADLALPVGAVTPLTDQPVSNADADGDLILVVGDDLSS